MNFFEVLSDLIDLMLLIEIFLSHPMSPLILVAACECVIALLGNYSHGRCPNFQGPKSPNCGMQT